MPDEVVPRPAPGELVVVSLPVVDVVLVPVVEACDVVGTVVRVCDVDGAVVSVFDVEGTVVWVCDVEDTVVSVSDVEGTVVLVSDVEGTVVSVSEVEGTVVLVSDVEDTVVLVSEVEGTVVLVSDVEDTVVLVLGVVVGVVAHVGIVKVLSSRETWPLRASARPATTVPVVTVIEVNAMIVPTKFEFVPSVAELPTCQYTWHAWAPLIRFTLLADAVIKVEATWKIQTVLESPWPSRVRVPLSESGPVDL
jgi:hypothetical protein